VSAGRAIRTRLVLLLVAVGGLALGGCGGGLARELARQAGELAELRARVAATEEEVRRLGESLAAVREQLERERHDAAAARAEADAGAQRALESLTARGAATARRVEELGEALSGLEAALGTLAEQLGRLETGSAASLRRPGPRQGGTSLSPEELFDRAMASFRAGELGQAVLDFEELIERHPGHPLRPSAHFWIGEAYFRSREFEHAAAEYQKALDLGPTGERSPDALLRLGLALRSLGREEPAREAWARLVRDFPESEAAQRARVLLREPARRSRPPPAPESR
jgi:tol-pal system protein YbgF